MTPLTRIRNGCCFFPNVMSVLGRNRLLSTPELAFAEIYGTKLVAAINYAVPLSLANPDAIGSCAASAMSVISRLLPVAATWSQV